MPYNVGIKQPLSTYPPYKRKMKKTLKEEMLEAIGEASEKYYIMENIYNESAASCTSIAEKHIKIARLEGMIDGLDKLKPFTGVWSDAVTNKVKKLEQELEQLKKQ